MPKIRIATDDQLPTPEAILFRINKITEECGLGGALTPAAARRVALLRARLPAKPGGALAPAVNHALLVGASDLTWGDRRTIQA